MKLKITLFWLFCLISGITIINAQSYPLNDFYNYYQKIAIKDTRKVLDQAKSKHAGNLQVFPNHGGKNQQWVVMPLYAKYGKNGLEYSRNNIIASRDNGKVMDISKSTNNVYCYSGFHGGENQQFQFNKRSGGYYEITSPYSPSFVLDRTGSSRNKNPFKKPAKKRDNLYFHKLHGGNNQQFDPINTIRIGNSPRIRPSRKTTIPKPPELKGFNAEAVTQTKETFISETWIPFSLVKSDLHPGIQVERTPYYRLERSQYYILPDGEEIADVTWQPGTKFTEKLTVKHGTKRTKAVEVFKKLNVGFSSKNEVTGKIGDLGLTSSNTFSTALEMSIKTNTSVEDTFEQVKESTVEFAVTEKTRFLTYALVDRYRLFRIDGTKILEWDVRSQILEPRTYPTDLTIQKNSNSKNGSSFRVTSSKGGTKNPIVWTSMVSVSKSSQSKLTSTAGGIWGAGAASVNRIPAYQDGWIETTAGSLRTGTMFGLSYNNTNATWNTIDFNFYLTEYGGGLIKIYNRRSHKKNIATKFRPGDKVRVERKGSTIYYKLNGRVIYSQACDRSKTLIADISLYKKGHYVNNSYCSHRGIGRKQEGNNVNSGNNNEIIDTSLEKDIEFSLYPNPSKGRFEISSNIGLKDVSIKIYATNGKLVYSKTLLNSEKSYAIDISSSQKGLYFMLIQHKDQLINKKILIK